MTINSMTGFGRSESTFGKLSWQWELKSVNGRNLDVRFRAPSGFEWLDQEMRVRIAARIKRGNIQANFQYKRQELATEVHIDQDVLAKVMMAGKEIADKFDIAPPTADGLLRVKGVVELLDIEETEEEVKARQEAILNSLDHAITELDNSRAAEGERLLQILNDHVHSIKTLTTRAKLAADARPTKIEDRFRDQLNTVLETSDLPEERLVQEVAILLTKADVTEELNRLEAHISAAQDLLKLHDPVGRKLDFLTQEFNREANTLCSKSSDIGLTQVGLELKAVIDQFREQVQNVE